MAEFSIAFNLTFKHEGGYTNHPNDNGNWTGGKVGIGLLIGTKFGISAPVLSKHLGRTATVEDMKNLSKDEVKVIYRKSYWNLIKGDDIPNQDIANDIYDTSVNTGVGAGIKLAQKTVDLPETGIMNDQLLTALRNLK